VVEVCVNGHIRTVENTTWIKFGRGDKLKRRCKDCRKRKPNGKPSVIALTMQRTTELHEDIEDLIKYGATFEEIVERSGFSGWETMRGSLHRRGRTDLLEKLRLKRV